MKIVEKNLNLWKDRVAELERKTPDFIESALSNRIKIREEEIQRLNLDKENHSKEIQKKNEELILFKSELKRPVNYKNLYRTWLRTMKGWKVF